MSNCYLECNLPAYLQLDIDNLVKRKVALDIAWCELYSSINSAEVDNEITCEQAKYLRRKYLYGEEY